MHLNFGRIRYNLCWQEPAKTTFYTKGILAPKETEKTKSQHTGSADLKPGMRIRVLRVHDNNAWARRLEALGMIQGTIVEVIREAPLGDPVEIELRGYRLCLRRKEFSALEWEPLEEPP